MPYHNLQPLSLNLSLTHSETNFRLLSLSLLAFTSTINPIMPRGGSGGRSARASRRARAAPAPKPANHTPPVPVQSGGGSFFGNIADGLAFGTGSAVAHRAVDAVMGPRTIRHETVATEAAAAPRAPAPSANSFGDDACIAHSKAFQDCLNSYGNEITKCQFYMDTLAECRKNSGTSLTA